MAVQIRKLTLTILQVFLFTCFAIGQFPHGLRDGRRDVQCQDLIRLIDRKPREILFGIDINTKGEIYFLMTSKQWFDIIFSSPMIGVAVDIVEKSRYDCTKPEKTRSDLPKGFVTPPMYKPAMAGQLKNLQDEQVAVKVGQVPANLVGKEIEGNLLIVKSELIAYYSNFFNIDRSIWELLPMGLFADNLIQTSSDQIKDSTEVFTYTRRVQVSIPFPKAKTTYSSNDIKPMYDSLNMKDYVIRKIEIRAYSSVEGPENLNKELMEGRANAMIRALKQFQVPMERIRTITAENWLEFLQDIKNTEYKDLSKLTKVEVKQKLLDKEYIKGIEPLLSRHRKAIVTLYMEPKTEATSISDKSILSEFQKAVQAKNVPKARHILKETVQRIMDNRIPDVYIGELEIPFEKPFASLLNDREIYQYILRNTDEYTALENFLELKKLDPNNGRINYNICALRFATWRYDSDSVNTNAFLNDINALPRYKIDASLVTRMLINYNILKCRDYMRKGDYAQKNVSLQFIKDNYPEIKLNDEEIFSIAKYFTYYAKSEWARELVTPRVDKIDVSEDLVFYYLNLGFFDPNFLFNNEHNQKALLNAVNLNRARFCKFFNANDRDGVGIQLLENDFLRKSYCENCTIDRMLGKN